MSSITKALPTTGPTTGPVARPVAGQLARTAAGILDDGNRFLPLPAQLATLLPQGGIRRGGTLRITPSPGATSLLMYLLAEPVRAGSWAAVVNIPDFGAEAAAELGVPLNRLAFVPTPGDQWLEVTATLLDNLDLVAIRPPSRCRGVDARRLAARTRQRNSVLIISSLPDVTRSNWPEPADVDLSTTASEWKGLQAGHGRLRYRELTITASGRRLPGRRQTRITVTEPVPQPGEPPPVARKPPDAAP